MIQATLVQCARLSLSHALVPDGFAWWLLSWPLLVGNALLIRHLRKRSRATESGKAGSALLERLSSLLVVIEIGLAIAAFGPILLVGFLVMRG